jgi:hypothetical protein
MSVAIQELLVSFEQLAEDEKQELASEIIRRVAHFEFSPLTDEELILTADAVFSELDRCEALHE